MCSILSLLITDPIISVNPPYLEEIVIFIAVMRAVAARSGAGRAMASGQSKHGPAESGRWVRIDAEILSPWLCVQTTDGRFLDI